MKGLSQNLLRGPPEHTLILKKEMHLTWSKRTAEQMHHQSFHLITPEFGRTSQVVSIFGLDNFLLIKILILFHFAASAFKSITPQAERQAQGETVLNGDGGREIQRISTMQISRSGAGNNPIDSNLYP